MNTLDDRRGDSDLDPIALDRLWDAMQRSFAPVGGRTGARSVEAAETIHQLTARDDAPRLPLQQVDTIWAAIAAATFAPGTAPAIVPPTGATGTRSVWQDLLGVLQSGIRQAAIGATSGMLIGAIVIGGGARLLMRLVALLSPPERIGTLTDNGNEVGAITLDGTISLLIAGMLAGLLGGIVVMAVRPWLPNRGWRRALLAGAIGFAVAGPVVLEGGNNPDYRRFGILGINVCLFTLLPFLFGIAIMPVVDWLDRRVPHDLPSLRRGIPTAALSLILVVLALPAIPALKTATDLDPAGLLMLLPLIRVALPLWVAHAPSSTARRSRERRGLRLGYTTLILPCLFGLLLMAQSVGNLLR